MSHNTRKATPEDYQELIRFVNLIFNEDFTTLLPKVYRNHPQMAQTHHIITENGGIKAALCSYPFSLYIAGKILKLRGIGSVCVPPDSRGKGYMRELMANAIREAIEDGTDMLCLDGQRQRYEYFGFGEAALRMEFLVTPINRRHYKDISSEGIQIIPLVHNTKYLSACKQLHDGQLLYVERPEEFFCDILANWYGEGWVILSADNFIGYASILKNKNEIQELILVHDAPVLPVIFKLVEFCGDNVTFLATCQQRELISALNQVSESSAICGREMINILNFPRVLEALFTYKGNLSKIYDGNFVIDITELGCYEIIVENGTVHVQKTKKSAALSLPKIQMTTWLFLPVNLLQYKTALEQNWFPLPIVLPRTDMV